MKTLCAILLVLIAGIAPALDSRWQKLGPETGNIPEIVADRKNPQLWFALDVERQFEARLYRSTDTGKTWIRGPLKNVTQVVVQDITSNVFVVTQNIDLWISKDHGVHFEHQNTTAIQLYKVFPDPTNQSILYASGYLRQSSTSSGALISRNAGQTWQELGNLPGFPAACAEDGCYYFFTDLVVSPTDKTVLFSGTIFDAIADPPIRYGHLLISSTDQGSSWKKVRNAEFHFYLDPFSDETYAFNNQGLWLLEHSELTRVSGTSIAQLVSVPGDARNWIGLQECKRCSERLDDFTKPLRLIRSTDHGKTWAADPDDLNHSLITVNTLNTPDLQLIAGTRGGGVYIRKKDWTASTGFLDPDISSVQSAGNKVVYSLSGKRWIFGSRSSGTIWSSIPAPSFLSLSMDPHNPLHLLGNTTNLSFPILETDDGGATWIVSSGLSEQGNYAHIAWDPIKAGIVYLSLEPYTTIYKSVDGGKTFQPQSLQFPSSVNSISRIFVDEYDDRIVYFGTSGGVFKSTNGGISAHAVNSGLPCCASSPYDFVPLGHKDNYLVLISDGSLFKTDNGGEQWHKVGSIDAYFAERLVESDRIGQHLFSIASTSDGEGQLFESLDGGKKWNNITAELGKSVSVREITDARNPQFYLATDHGVFRNRP